MEPEPIDPVAYLRALSAERIFYCPNGGNAGDALIAEATYQAFAAHGIRYAIPGPEDDLRDGIVAYGGGGNLVARYATCRDFVARHHRLAKRFVLLPHSVQGHEELLRELGPNVDVFCRELVSYAHVKQLAPRANVMLADDLALRLDVPAALRGRSLAGDLLGSVGPRFLANYVQAWGVRAVARWRLRGRAPDERFLSCFRVDGERTDAALPPGNVDLSALFSCSMVRRGQVALIARFVLSFLKWYHAIATNRLHVGIAAALLGKRVELHPNSYYKVAAVYDFSLKGRFPCVRWAGP